MQFTSLSIHTSLSVCLPRVCVWVPFRCVPVLCVGREARSGHRRASDKQSVSPSDDNPRQTKGQKPDRTEKEWQEPKIRSSIIDEQGLPPLGLHDLLSE